MKKYHVISVNFKGGIISPGDLFNILVAAEKSGVTHVKFGLRQQLLIDVPKESFEWICGQLQALDMPFHTSPDAFPNIISSYAAEEIFITNNWLSEGVYKDILDGFEQEPQLKINIADCNQSFTPLLTGNINWVAHPQSPHYWYCLIRFPKTNIVYESKELVYTNDLSRYSNHLEDLILNHKSDYCINGHPEGDKLFKLLNTATYLTKTSINPVSLHGFNLPYYEGLNRYNNKFWLGIYRRDEKFSLDFLKALCMLCLKTKLGQICSTAWKSLIIKGINENDRSEWNLLLAQFQINVRHAANELNFQVEDNCTAGLALKNYLVRHLNIQDTRTFGVCFGIKTRKKSEVFSSILIRKRSLFKIFGIGCFNSYDILCAHDYNPNKRTGFIFSRGNPKWLLPEQVRRAIYSYYQFVAGQSVLITEPGKLKEKVKAVHYIHQCGECFTVYHNPEKSFDKVEPSWVCNVCDAPKTSYRKVEQQTLGLEAL